MPRVIVLMGTSGSGKTTVGSALAEAVGGSFVDADEFHPAENVAKMAAGVPLGDGDRRPWLERLRREVVDAAPAGMVTVLACSALKRDYRRRLGVDGREVVLVYLAGGRDLLWKRMSGRSGHFMKPEMLAGQCEALEEPEEGEGMRVSIDATVAEMVAEIRERLGLG